VEVNYLTDDLNRPSDPPASKSILKKERDRFLAETRPIPRSDPNRKTPRATPEDKETLRLEEEKTGKRPGVEAKPEAKPEAKSEDRPEDSGWDEEPQDEVDKGWDL
jgi:hypothetical protein